MIRVVTVSAGALKGGPADFCVLALSTWISPVVGLGETNIAAWRFIADIHIIWAPARARAGAP